MGLRDILLVALAVMVAGCAGLGSGEASELQISPAAAEGRRLVQRSCSGCHATNPEGSLYSAAPPLWSLGRATPELLQRVLAQSPAHDPYAMPGIVLTLEEAARVIAYIDALAAADRETRSRLAVRPCFGKGPC